MRLTAMTTALNRKTIVLPFDQEKYPETVRDPKAFRAELDRIYKKYPQLFPEGFDHGYLMKDIRYSKKMDLYIRRININGACYSVRPSFVLPYMAAFTDDVEDALQLRKHHVPYWQIAQIFGRNPMFWYRIEQQIGRNSIVGTTVQKKT